VTIYGSVRINYGFATGRVRVLETKLVSPQRIARLVEAESLEEIHQVLAETDYGAELRHAATVEQVEEAMDEQLEKAYRLLEESNLPSGLSRYFRLRHDFINLRIVVKGGFGQEIDAALSDLGELPAKELEGSIKQHTFEELPPLLGSAAKEAIAAYSIDKDIELIDMVLDRRYFAELSAIAKGLNSRWITGYTQLQIDLANGRIAIRSRQKNMSSEQLERHLIPGGGMGAHTWVLLPGVVDDPAGAAKLLSRWRGLRQVAAWLDKGLPVAEYDLIADKLLLDYLDSTERFKVGPEPVFGYVAAKEQEIKLLRLIITGHLSGVPAAKLQERVGLVYA
jgi:V/A-type H+/Na+-transporting ATPase subunit C